MKRLTGINIQWPISTLILNGKKTIETRTYPLPLKFLNQELLMIETPGKNGNFKARIVAIIKFIECFEYKSKKEFYQDVKNHCVSPDSEWAWKIKKKFGWKVVVIKVFNTPITAPAKKGIVFTKDLEY